MYFTTNHSKMQALFSVFLDILYAINKKSIKKEDVRPRRTDYLVNKGSDTSSTISISDMLEIVKENSDDIKLVTSVLSKDVCEKLGIERPICSFGRGVFRQWKTKITSLLCSNILFPIRIPKTNAPRKTECVYSLRRLAAGGE